MENVLLAILANDNFARAAAESQFTELKRAYPRDVLLQLSAVLYSSPNETYRSLTAILLRGIVLREPQMWGFLTSEEFEFIRSQLLQSLAKEEIGHIQRKIANTVATHARLAQWPQLMDGIILLSSSINVKNHDLCLYLLDQLAENIGTILISNLDLVMNIILPLLGENNSIQTRTLAAQALGSVLFEIPMGNVLIFDSLRNIPHIIKAIMEAQEDLLLQDLLSNLFRLTKEKSELFVNSWELLFLILHTLCVDENLESGSKVLGLEILIALITSKSSFCSTIQSRKDVLLLCMKLMTAVEEEDEAISSTERPQSEESGFGDVDGDGGDGNLSDFAAVSLDTLTKCFEPEEVLQVCMVSAWGLVTQPDWRSRRAALLIVSIICEGVRDCLYVHLKTLVPTIISSISDPHPRVRYIALHCLDVFISEFTGNEEDDDENNVKELSFQKLFHDTPTIICNSIQLQLNYSYPRILYAALNTLKTFFNPDICTKKNCLPFGARILDLCMKIFQDLKIPSFVRGECASVIGNVSILYSDKLHIDQYHLIITALKYVIFDNTNIDSNSHTNSNSNSSNHNSNNSVLNNVNFSQNNHENSLLKGKCLESVALLGKAVGRKVFSPIAHEFLKIFTESHNKGLDFSDPVSSYIIQSCARIAGVIEEEFELYIPYFIPPLLNRIAQDIKIEINDVENCFTPINSGTQNNNSDTNSSENTENQENLSKKDVFTIYQRGMGNINVVCNTHEIEEKETICRCLYQYCTDIPLFLWKYSVPIIDSIGPLLTSNVNKSEDLFIIINGIILLVHKMYLKYSSHHLSNLNDSNTINNQIYHNNTEKQTAIIFEELKYVEMANEISSKSLNFLKIAFQQSIYLTQNCKKNEYNAGIPLIIVESINDILKIRWERTVSLCTNKFSINFDLELLTSIIILVRERSVLYVQRRFLDPEDSRLMDDEDGSTEDDLWSAMIECIGHIIKICKDSMKEFLARELFPFIQSLMSMPESPSMLMMFPICVLLDIVEHSPSSAEECSAIVLPSLFTYLTSTDLTVSCTYGLGVCAMYGGTCFDQYCGKAVSVLLSLTGADTTGLRALSINEEEIDMDSVKDNAYSSLLKISIFKQNILLSTAEQLLQYCFQNFPLNSDISEAKSAHNLFIDLLIKRDQRLLGASGNFENLSQVLFILAQLCAIDDESRIQKMLSNTINLKDDDDEEFWDKQIISACTLHQARTVLKDFFSETGISKEVLGPALESQPEEAQQIILYFSQL